MAAAAGGQSVTAYQPPIEELAQDAVVWASQHGLVRHQLLSSTLVTMLRGSLQQKRPAIFMAAVNVRP